MVGVMDPSVPGSALAALGEDLFLLSIRRRDGKLLTRGRIDSALMASELIRLAAAGRAWIAEGRIVARDQTATGDPELDAALLSLAGATSPPRPETWVGLPRRGIRAAYAARLTSAGALRLESSRVLGTRLQSVPRATASPTRRGRRRPGRDWTPSRSPPGRRLRRRGADPDPAQVALAGLASAIGLGDVLYPGREGRAQRARMARIARQQVITHASGGPRLRRWPWKGSSRPGPRPDRGDRRRLGCRFRSRRHPRGRHPHPGRARRAGHGGEGHHAD